MLTPSWSSGSAKVSAVGRPPTYDQAVADAGVGAGHLLDAADAVLEADQRRVAVGDRGDGDVVEHGVGPAVDDDAEVGGLADLAHVLDEPGLAGLGEVGRHQQEAVRAGGLGSLGLGDRVLGRASRRSKHGYGARHLVDGRLDDAVGLLEREAEPLARAARGEEPGDGVLRQPREVLAVGRLVELQVVGEVRHREREQTALQLGGQIGRAVLGHKASFVVVHTDAPASRRPPSR